MDSPEQTDSKDLPAMTIEPVGDVHIQQLAKLVERSQKLMSHAWMVRTFVKHSDEVDDFPELNEMARTIFDVFRALETQVHDPAS